jgi:hypothetical protein
MVMVAMIDGWQSGRRKCEACCLGPDGGFVTLEGGGF